MVRGKLWRQIEAGVASGVWLFAKTVLLPSRCSILQRIASGSSTVLAQDHFYSDFCCLPSTCQTQASSMAMICWQRQGEGVCTQQVDDNWGCHLLNGCMSACFACLLLLPCLSLCTRESASWPCSKRCKWAGRAFAKSWACTPLCVSPRAHARALVFVSTLDCNN